MAHLDAPSDWRPGGRGFNPRRGRQHSFVEIDYEIFSTVILSLPLIQEGQLSVSSERMCTILVNRLEDQACPVNVWLGKLTALDMTPLGWLGRKTSTQTNNNLRNFLVLILQKLIGSRYLDPVIPTTVLSRSFWNFTGALRMVWRYACGFFRILKLFFITGFLLQYLGKWYRTNGPLVNFTIFNTSNKNKAGDINSPWNLLVRKLKFEVDALIYVCKIFWLEITPSTSAALPGS